MRPMKLVSILSLAAALAACATTGPRTDVAAVPAAGAQVPTQLPRNVRPLHYSLSIAPDAPNLRFTGSALIDVNMLAPTDTITLNALDLDFASVTLDGGARARVTTDGDAQTATFHFPGQIPAGRHRLAIDYSGKINTQAVGLFALDYQSDQGAKRALFTQFEASDARRMFPSWDEPSFRTPYDLRVVVPAGQQSVGNMPEAGREMRPDGSAIVTFRTTPAMSSYLVFLAVGEFDRITATAPGGTEVGVVTRRGAGEQGRWALESQRQILPWYNRYFGTPYPLPKLDNVAGPGSSQFFGAMENWGAIFSFENLLLVDPSITTEARRQAIFSVDAHEMAHQWFGDLVTMAWWDDIWLNEGFASWMASKSTAAIHPEWETALDRVNDREAAITLDSLHTTHPVVQHIVTPDQMSQAFDSITYQKGEAVITMLENYVGETAWRDGVRAYIRAHRLGNTQSDDLWRAVEGAARRPITQIAHDFTLQPGVPLIRVEAGDCTNGHTLVSLRQGQFSRDNPDAQPLTWRVPVIADAGGAEARTLVAGSDQVTVPGCGPLVVNYGQAGYYRTLYSAPLLARLIRSYAQLRPIDQIGLLADNWALGLAGYQPASAALDMADAAPAGANDRLVSRIAGMLGQIDAMYDGDAAHQAMVRRYASAKLAPALRRLGWAPRPGESASDAVLRGTLIETLGRLGDAGVVAEANRRFASGDPSATAGPLRETILDVVALNADAATWDRLRAMARDEHNPLVRVQLYGLLGSASDPALAQRALDLALTDEPGATNSARLVGSVAAAHPDLAFDFAVAHRERVEALVDATSRTRFLPGLASRSSDPAMIEKLRQYAERYMTPQSRAPADRAIASIQDRLRVRRDRLPDISRWFEARRAG